MERCIHPDARMGNGTVVGLYSVIEENVVIGDNVQIGHHVVIHAGTRIGDRVRIDDHAVIGKRPLAARRSKTTRTDIELQPAVIGNDCLVGTAAIIYAGCTIGNGVLVADSASVREHVTIGDDTIIGRNVSVDNKVRIGARCKIQTNSYICGYSEIGDDCFIAPCVATSNDNYVGRWKERTKYYRGVTVETGGRIGVHATTLPGRVIGRDGLVGAGSVVSRDVPEGTVVYGVPARDVRPVPENQRLENQEE